MRIKFLSVIVSFLLMSVAISSCLDSDETYDLSSDATIRAFGIDTITYGKYYAFTIDQLKREIYNVDSLPVGADTIIDRILIDTLNVSGWVTAGPTDTLFNREDSVDLRTPLELTVHAADGVTSLKYTIRVNVHKQDPDSLIWREMQPFSASAVAEQKTVLLNNDLYVFTSSSTAYRSSVSRPNNLQWESVAITGLPADAKYSSIVSYNDVLYTTTEDGKAFSSANGTVWSEMDVEGMHMIAFVTGIPENIVESTLSALVGIYSDNGTNRFCKKSTNDASWVKGDETVPDGFPLKGLHSTVFTIGNGGKQIFLIGNTETEMETTTPWSTVNGLRWVDMNTITSATACPIASNPSIMYYGGSFYMMGGDFKIPYTSLAGLDWFESDKKFRYASEKIVTPGEGEDAKETIEYKSLFEGKGAYSLVVDNNNYIWIVWNDGSVWRGRLNRLSFLIQ